MLRNMQGIHAPLKLQMEFNTARQVGPVLQYVLCTLKCLSIGTAKTINFSVPNGK